MRAPIHHLASLTLAVGISICVVENAQADVIPIDIAGLVNADLTTYTGGGNYPPHGGPLVLAGVPFTLATIGQNSDTAMIQSSSDSGVLQTYTLNVGLFGVTSAHTLINSAFGTCGTNVGELDFIGSSDTFPYLLTEGDNVRDHFEGDFCNMLKTAGGSVYFGTGVDRLDMQSIVLPAVFATETLQRIDFKTFGQAYNGSPFLAAATVETTSEPQNLSVSAAAPEPAMGPVGFLAVLAVLLVRGLRLQH